MVRIYDWTSEREVRLECSHANMITALTLRTKGDFILVGDMMRSVVMLHYRSAESNLEEIARDFDPKWIVDLELLDDDLCLTADNFLNLCVLQKNSAAASDDDRMHMNEVS